MNCRSARTSTIRGAVPSGAAWPGASPVSRLIRLRTQWQPAVKKCRSGFDSAPALLFSVPNYFLQHFAQLAASVQHFMQVAWSLQQLPSHFIAAAAGLAHEPSLQCAQPVVIIIPAAKTAASSIIVFMFGILFCSVDSTLPIAPTAAIGKFIFICHAARLNCRERHKK